MCSALRERTAYVVALTGGIASGKSAVASRFVALGVPLVDADQLAHQLVEPGQPALVEIATAFGDTALDAHGALDRQRMRNRVFADAEARRRLESILHPRIHDAIVATVRDCESPYCVLAIPLFAETQSQYVWVDRVIVTDVPRAIQIQRLTARPQIDVGLAERIVDAQAKRDARLQLSDDVIDNGAPIERLERVVARLHDRYRTLAAKRA
jgi:dephospho-CoA kinase